MVKMDSASLPYSLATVEVLCLRNLSLQGMATPLEQ